MSKAILVIDVDGIDIDIENTRVAYIELECHNHTMRMSLINHWLKPLPQEKYVYWKDYMQPIDKSEEQTNIFNKGYNHCLKEILGEQDNE